MPIPTNVGLTVAANGIFNSDVPYIKKFPWALLIATWEQETLNAWNILTFNAVYVKYIRFMNDPSNWSSFPKQFLTAKGAVFGNEPDIEGPNTMEPHAENMWKLASGNLMEPAYSDDSKAPKDVYIPGNGYPNKYDIHTAHCYAGNWTNANKVAARCNDGRPVVITEYGNANHQDQCLQDIVAAKVQNDVALFTLRWVGNTNAGYDIIGTEFK
jgi:hypothetical protein